MDELMEILMEIDPDVDYENETQLIDGKVLDSFSIVSLISEISGKSRRRSKTRRAWTLPGEIPKKAALRLQ